MGFIRDAETSAQGAKPFISLWEEAGLHAVIDTVPDAMVIADEAGSIRSFSTGAEKMFGYSESEVLGKNVGLLMPSSEKSNHESYMRRYQETRISRILGIGRVTTARNRDGTTFPINISLGEINVEGTRGYVAFIRDLTESRETERELHTLQSELAHVSRISSMGGMATSLAHELNQPLTAVTNYANSANDLLKNPSEENITLVRQALDECAHEALRAGQIVHRLRDFISRGETARHIVSLRRLVKEASALALMNGDGKQVDFDTRLDPDLDEVLVDPIQIQQVVLNLIRNALEAMLESPHKRLLVKSRPGKPGFVELVVADSGPGLDNHIADRLFHPFNTSKESGMGLGLSICHTIITAHGGKIATQPSRLGGTAFHITLPLAAQGDDDG